MAEFFDRLEQIVRAEITDASLRQDLRLAVEQVLQEMQQTLASSRQAILNAASIQASMEHRLNKAQAEADNWRQRAELALEKEDDGLATVALRSKTNCLKNVAMLTAQLERQAATIETLKRQQVNWEIKFAEAQAKKYSLIKRLDSLVERVEKAINPQPEKIVGNMSTASAMAAFDRMEEKVLQMNAHSKAADELKGKSLEEMFAMLETGSDVNDELAEMKAKLLGSTSQQPSSTVDDELEELKRKLDAL